jgi:hypothetical protein
MSQSSSNRPTLRDALVAKLGNPDRRRLHALANRVRSRLGQMSTAEAYAVLAAEHGLKLHKYLAGDDLERVRRILAGGAAQPSAASGANGGRARTKARVSLKEIMIDGAAFVMDDPILPPQITADAQRMARIYPLTYVFENSVRELVVRVMQGKYGPGWWKQPMVPGKVLRDVETTKRNEASVPWHGQRGRHEINYTSIDNLVSIITTNDNWPLFAPILGEQNAIGYLIQVIEQSRHTIAHHNPLSQDDLNILKVNVRAWQEVLRKHRDLI